MLKQPQIDKWTATRAQGRSNFIWKTGVGFWGVTTGTLWAFAMSYIQGWSNLVFLLPLALILFPIGGYFWGVWVWNKMEEYHQRAASGSSSAQ